MNMRRPAPPHPERMCFAPEAFADFPIVRDEDIAKLKRELDEHMPAGEWEEIGGDSRH